MEVGVLTVPFGDQSLDETLEYLDGIGVGAVELGCGGFPGDDHLPRRACLSDADRREEVLAAVDEYDVTISALAAHGNPIHPDEDRAANDDALLREAIELADEMGVDAVTCFSGLPAGSEAGEVPNWITAPWPTEHADALEYQWDVAVDYWSDIGEHAESHGVDVAIEMHPNMLVYEPSSMLRLREATNDRIGANFDPSHLYWQGISVTDAIRLLGEHDAIHHFHAKDTKVYEERAREKGVLDTTAYTDEIDRSWLFRSVGYGHGEDHWRHVVSTLRMVGYDGALSIEHEDSLTSAREGLEKGVDLLNRVIFETQPGDAHWV